MCQLSPGLIGIEFGDKGKAIILAISYWYNNHVPCCMISDFLSDDDSS